jgi:serine protease Do
MTNSRSWRGRALAFSLLAGTALGGLALTSLPLSAQAQSDPSVVQPKPGAIEPGQISHPLPDFVSLVRQVKPAVVSITSKMHPDEDEEGQGGGMPGFGHGQGMPFGFPFAMPQQQQRQRLVEARGSGFLIDSNGTIVTNNHVVRGATSVSVTMDDGTVLPAKVIGRDKASDLAVLRVKANHPLPFINLGDSNAAQPGAWVVAVGNPFGLGGTVTAGIVSARGRDIGEGNYDSFLQIDAPINQGNSGGPLFTQDGKVVGVNSAIISPNGGGSVGIGFAIPSNTVKSVVAQLERTGHVTRGYIGVQAQAVNAAMSDALHLPAGNTDEHGALVASVESDGPASHAGVTPGDVIVAVNGQHVGNPRELAIDVSQVVPGNHAKLDVLRQGHTETLDVTVGTLPTDGSGHPNALGSGEGQGLGVSLSGITPNVRQQLDLAEGTRGAVITEVKPGSPAEQAGLQPGDVITGVGEHPVTGTADASRAIREQLKSNQAVALRIVRNGENLFVAVSPAQNDQSETPDDGNG